MGIVSRSKSDILIMLGVMMGIIGFLIGVSGLMIKSGEVCIISIIIIIIAFITYRYGESGSTKREQYISQKYKTYEKMMINFKILRLGFAVFLFSIGIFLFAYFSVYINFEMYGATPEILVDIAYLAITGLLVGGVIIISAFESIRVEQKEFDITEIQKIEELKRARDEGLISEDEFEYKKNELLWRL